MVQNISNIIIYLDAIYKLKTRVNPNITVNASWHNGIIEL